MTGGKEHCVLHTLIESISNSGHKIKIISNIVSNVSNYDVLKLPDVKTMKKTSSYSNKNIRNILTILYQQFFNSIFSQHPYVPKTRA